MSALNSPKANDQPLNLLLHSAGLEPVSDDIAAKFDAYLHLLLRWNDRINLTAVRDSQDILSRHFVESIACARRIPDGIASLLDFGSGAGFPGIPIALCRPEIAVTLAESQNKKASFLREVVRSLGLSSVVFAQRGETLKAEFDCVALRAVDQMSKAVISAASLVGKPGWLAIMTTTTNSPVVQNNLGSEFRVQEMILLPGSNQRILLLAARVPFGS